MSTPFQATIVIVCRGEVDLQADHIAVHTDGANMQIVFPIMTTGTDLPEDPEVKELVVKVIANNVIGAAREKTKVPGWTSSGVLTIKDTPTGERH